MAVLFEFKIVEIEPEGKPPAQLAAKGFAEKYLDRGEPVYPIVVEFSRRERGACGFALREVKTGEGGEEKRTHRHPFHKVKKIWTYPF
jgi:hypothetical protein